MMAETAPEEAKAVKPKKPMRLHISLYAPQRHLEESEMLKTCILAGLSFKVSRDPPLDFTPARYRIDVVNKNVVEYEYIALVQKNAVEYEYVALVQKNAVEYEYVALVPKNGKGKGASGSFRMTSPTKEKSPKKSASPKAKKAAKLAAAKKAVAAAKKLKAKAAKSRKTEAVKPETPKSKKDKGEKKAKK